VKYYYNVNELVFVIKAEFSASLLLSSMSRQWSFRNLLKKHLWLLFMLNTVLLIIFAETVY